MTVLRSAALFLAALTLTSCSQPSPFGGPEGATYDAQGDRFLVSNVGAFDDAADGFILALGPDGEAQVPRWAPAAGERPLGNPLGVAVHDGVLYVANTPDVRRFDLATGAEAAPAITIAGARTLNDLAVAPDGTVYVTDSGTEEPSTWAVYRITAAGDVSTIVNGEVLSRPNGVDVGPDGRIYVAVMTQPAVVVLNDAGAVVETIAAPHAGNDGIIVLPEGIILSSVVDGIVSFIAEDGSSRTIADDLPGAASIGYDPTRRRIAVPRIAANTVDFVDLDD